MKWSFRGNLNNFSSVTHSSAGMTLAFSLSQARCDNSLLNQETGILSTTNIKRLVNDFFNNVCEGTILRISAAFEFVVGGNGNADSDITIHISSLVKLNDQIYHESYRVNKMKTC